MGPKSDQWLNDSGLHSLSVTKKGRLTFGAGLVLFERIPLATKFVDVA